MLPIVASLIAVCLATLAATSTVLRRWRRDLIQQLTNLQTELNATRHELSALKATINTTRIQKPVPQHHDFLEQIEQLGDLTALANENAIEQAVREINQSPSVISADLFTADHKLLDISRLIDNGHTLSDIARRLHIPLGEVELLASLRTH